MSSSFSNGWAFDGALSDAFALFMLGSGKSEHKEGRTSSERSYIRGEVVEGDAQRDTHNTHWVDEITVFTAVDRHDHHISMLRLWYSDVLDTSV